MPINCSKILASADIDKVQNAVESRMCDENLFNEVYKYDSFPGRIFVLFHCKNCSWNPMGRDKSFYTM